MVDPIEAVARAIAAEAGRLDEDAPETCGRLQFVLNRSDLLARAAYAVLAPILREEGARAMQEAALRALRTAQYDPAPYTKGKGAIEALNPAEIVGQ